MGGWGAARVVVLLVLVLVASLGECRRRSSRRRHPMTRLLQEDKIVAQLQLIQKLLGAMGERTGCPINDTHSDLRKLSAPPPTTPTTTTTTIAPTTEETATEKESDMKTAKPTEPSECDYSDISANHTMLLPKAKGCRVHKSDITEEEIKLVLDTHNDFRSKVARGEETMGNPGPQPPAANMRQLVWNDELAKVALAWAFQCPDGHDKHEDRKLCSRDYYVGQNIHYYWGNSEKPDWRRAVNDWYWEVIDFPKEVASSFRKTPGKMTGHYTQLVWGDSHEIGCGVIYYTTKRKGKLYKQSKIYVCNYGPTGNINTLPLYQEGEAASQCEHGVSTEHLGLCL